MLSVLFSIVFASFSAHAFLENAKTPVCLDGRSEISVDNQSALRFKSEEKNGALTRAFIRGRIISAPVRQGDHDRFSISIGSGPRDTVEVIYNVDFGSMPAFSRGDDVVVCGDFINSFAQNGRYKPSPDGAIIHWVHYNPGDRSTAHEHGFIQIETDLVGFDDAPRQAWTGAVVRGSQGQNQSRRIYESESSTRY